MKVPSGIKNNQMLRLKNKGFSEVNRYKTGDQYIRINVRIPDKVNNDMKNVVQSLKDIVGENIEFKKIKN